MADPLLQGLYPMRGLYQALAVAAMCLQEQAATRPLIGDVVTALSYLASQSYDPNKTGPSTPRSREDWKSLSLGGDSQLSINSPSRNSPDLRKRVGLAAEMGRGKLGLEESEQGSQKGSPVINGPKGRNGPKNLDRERAVAEARIWGENWRDRRHENSP